MNDEELIEKLKRGIKDFISKAREARAKYQENEKNEEDYRLILKEARYMWLLFTSSFPNVAKEFGHKIFNDMTDVEQFEISKVLEDANEFYKNNQEDFDKCLNEIKNYNC